MEINNEPTKHELTIPLEMLLELNQVVNDLENVLKLLNELGAE
jgi:hypothetical protein